MITKLRWNY